MGDLGVQSSTPAGMEAVRAKHTYYSMMARLAQIEMQKEDNRLALQRLVDEEADLKKKTADYEKKHGA